MMYLHKYTIISALAVLLLPSCADDKPHNEEPSQIYADEYYSGGKLGTSFNHTASAYEQFAPAVEEQGLVASFKRGERIFESPFDTGSDATQPMRGLGPLWVRTSCIACHPSYGHGQRQTQYNSNNIGNGYLLVLTDENDTYLSSLTGMPQTQAAAPFKAPIDEKKIKINWEPYTDEWGNKFPDLHSTCGPFR